MNKKILLLIFLVFTFFLTGCDAKYQMEIKDSKITEDLSFSIPNEYNEKKINELIDYYEINNESSFTHKIIKESNATKVSLAGKNTKIDAYFENSDSFINKCYNSVSFLLEDGKYFIGTSAGFKCLTYDYMELDSVAISIKTYHKVYDSNADEVNKNVYTWHIDRNNISTHKILLIVSKSEYIWYYKYRYLFGGLIVVFSVFLITYLVISIFRLSSKKVNKI